MVAVTQTTLPPSVESSLVGRKTVLTYIQRPYLHEGRRKGEEEEEGEGEVRFAFVRVARLRKRGRDREGRDECLTAPVGGNEGMEKREDGMEARGGDTSGSHVPVTVLQVYKKRNFRLS